MEATVICNTFPCCYGIINSECVEFNIALDTQGRVFPANHYGTDKADL